MKYSKLSKAIREIESNFGSQLSALSESDGGPNPEIDDSDDSSDVDVPAAEQPSHLRSLFQNEWLSVDTSRQTKQIQGRQAKMSANLLDVAKQAIQKLIPTKEEFFIIANSSSKWLGFLETLLPQPFAITSQRELLESYDKMCEPDVTAVDLAAWLLTLAITAEQEPQGRSGPISQSTKHRKSSDFSRTVSDTVERTILSHDRLVGTVQGLAMGLHFIRL